MTRVNRTLPLLYFKWIMLGAALGMLGLTGPCWGEADSSAETVRVMSYNVEHFTRMFDQVQMPERSQNQTELFRDEEDMYEVARVIKLGNPDIIGMQEACDQEMLEYFNEHWLDSEYSFVKAFAGNVEGMAVAIMVKKGFKVLETKDQYYLEPDLGDPKKHPLFSRGPGFVLVETPEGNRFWVGATHVKSKYGNSKSVTQWRIRELRRTREICGELLALGKTDNLIIMGDFNDDLGRDSYEEALGIDAVGVMVEGEKEERLLSPSFELVRNHPEVASYHCEIKPKKYRSFIDHVFVSPGLEGAVESLTVIDDPIAAVASDHYPLLTVLTFTGQ